MSRKGGETPAPPPPGLFGVALANIRVPTLLVRGKLSDVVVEEGVADFLAEEVGTRLPP